MSSKNTIYKRNSFKQKFKDDSISDGCFCLIEGRSHWSLFDQPVLIKHPTVCKTMTNSWTSFSMESFLSDSLLFKSCFFRQVEIQFIWFYVLLSLYLEKKPSLKAGRFYRGLTPPVLHLFFELSFSSFDFVVVLTYTKVEKPLVHLWYWTTLDIFPISFQPPPLPPLYTTFLPSCPRIMLKPMEISVI